MDSFMWLKSSWMAESLGAIWATIWFFFSVSFFMASQCTWQLKWHTTPGAAERFLVSVYFFMNFQCTRSYEFFSTLKTAEGLLASMGSSFMCLQWARDWEFFVTDWTTKWLLTRMDPSMDLQTPRSLRFKFTLATGKEFPVCHVFRRDLSYQADSLRLRSFHIDLLFGDVCLWVYFKFGPFVVWNQPLKRLANVLLDDFVQLTHIGLSNGILARNRPGTVSG